MRTPRSLRPAMVVVAATRLEAGAARRGLRGTGVEVVTVGVGGAALRVAEGAGPVVVVGLCGALVPLAPGTVVVPDEVREAEGPVVRCDPELVRRLREAAAARDWLVVGGLQLTARAILRGGDRAAWAERGFQTVDMEAARVLRRAPGAVVRVVLDGPGDELPRRRQLINPRSWPAAGRVALRAPRYAERAALTVSDLFAMRAPGG